MDAAQSLTLHHGPLRFSAWAQGEGPTVLCLHGFPDHARSFRHQLPALAEAGYRAISPTLRGYEPSSQPADGRYDIVALAEDLLAWIDELGEDRVHLVGHDWGALIGFVATAMAPERFDSLVTLAAPHIRRFGEGWRVVLPSQLRRSWYILFFQARGLADWAVARREHALIAWLWRDWSPDFSLPPDEWAALQETFAQPGVTRAALGYYRANMGSVTGLREGLGWALRKTAVPTLLLTGANDGCADTRLHDFGAWQDDFTEEARVVRVEGTGHFLHQEAPAVVNEAIVDWVRAHDGR